LHRLCRHVRAVWNLRHRRGPGRRCAYIRLRVAVLYVLPLITLARSRGYRADGAPSFVRLRFALAALCNLILAGQKLRVRLAAIAVAVGHAALYVGVDTTAVGWIILELNPPWPARVVGASPGMLRCTPPEGSSAPKYPWRNDANRIIYYDAV
jgi:hypothetical protein